MKYSTEITTNNVKDLEIVRDLYYDLKNKFSNEDDPKYQTISLKLKIEIEVV